VDNDIRAAVAHHEAGHAVIASRLGLRVGTVCLDDRQPRAELAPEQTIDRFVKLQIDLAGPLAEIKFTSTASFGCQVNYDLGDVDSLLQILRDGSAVERNPGVWLNLCGIGRRWFVPGDGNVFSDLEDLQESSAVSDLLDDQLRQSLRATMAALDETPNWEAIQAVADKLLERGRVEPAQFVEIMKAWPVSPSPAPAAAGSASRT